MRLFVFFHVFGIYIFIKGFLFIKNPTKIENKRNIQRLGNYDRLLLIVIDGLSYRFAEQYLQEIRIKDSHLFYNAYADPPTVTLQRLKSIATGTLPSFIEIGNNFDVTHHIKFKSFVEYFYNEGNVSVAGDDTWISLFGPKITRQFTTESFNVRDIYHVDKVVFSNFRNEMLHSDSGLIIGHFLSVDHAGHSYGYLSEEVRSKTREIDHWIRNEIISNMRANDLLMVLGDHGMTDSGSHGGASYDETHTFLYVYSPIAKKQTVNEIEQVDICSTICLLFGFPIPIENVGTPILDLFPKQSDAELAKSETLKQHQLLLKTENLSLDNEYTIADYFRAKYNQFDLFAMVVGWLLIMFSMLFMRPIQDWFVIAHGISMFSHLCLFGENLVVQFLLGLRNQSIVLRVLGLFTRCREDAHKRICSPFIRLSLPAKYNQGLIKLIGVSNLVPFLLFCVAVLFSDRSGYTVHLLSLHGFFSLAHEFTFSGLNIEAAFAFGHYHKILSPMSVFLNTFLTHFIGCALTKEIDVLQACNTFDLLCIMTSCIFIRNHLLIWQVFAPRFLFQSITVIITDIICICNSKALYY